MEDFSDPRNRVVLGAIRALLEEDVPPDPVAVLAHLRRCGELSSFADDRNAGVFNTDLLAGCPVAASAPHYRRAVLEHSLRRRAVEAAQRLEQAAGSASLETLQKLIGSELMALIQNATRCGDQS